MPVTFTSRVLLLPSISQFLLRFLPRTQRPEMTQQLATSSPHLLLLYFSVEHWHPELLVQLERRHGFLRSGALLLPCRVWLQLSVARQPPTQLWTGLRDCRVSCRKDDAYSGYITMLFQRFSQPHEKKSAYKKFFFIITDSDSQEEILANLHSYQNCVSINLLHIF